MISKSKIASYFILLSLLLAFNVFAFTGIAMATRLLALFLGLTGFALFVLYFRNYNKQLRVLGVILILLYSQSILSANLIYNQSISVGALANMPFLIGGVGFLVHFLIVRYHVSIARISYLIIRTSWIIFAAYIIVQILGIEFHSNNVSKALSLEALNKGFINLGAIIYIAKYFHQNHVKYLFLGLLLFSTNMWADFQRNIFIIFFITIFVSLLFNRQKVANFKAGLILIVSIPMITIILQNTQFGSVVSEKIGSALELFEDDKNEFSDSSVGARVEETEFAFTKISKHPITGMGRISSMKRPEVLGNRYFFVTDIGLIGVLFSLGFLGIFFYLYEFYLAIKMGMNRRLSLIEEHTGYKMFLFFLVIHSIMTGISVFEPAPLVLMISIISIERNTNSANKSIY